MYVLDAIIRQGERALPRPPQTEAELRRYVADEGIRDHRYQVEVLNAGRFRLTAENRELLQVIKDRCHRAFVTDPVQSHASICI